MKVTIGLVLAHGFPVPVPFVISYSHILQTLLTGAGNATLPRNRQIDSCRALFGQDFPIDWARNRLCQLFLDDDNGDYLLFLDTDMTHPPDLPHRLIKHGKDVVSGRYVTRKPPHFTVAMKKIGDQAHEYQAVEKVIGYKNVTGLIPIDAAGAGALLISRKCLVAIRKHLGQDNWFMYQDGFDQKTGTVQLRSRSEDMWFFEKARECGFQPYLDADANCGHIAQFEVDYKFHEPYKEALDKALAGAV